VAAAPLAAVPARVLAAGSPAANLARACGAPGTRSWLCETVYRITGDTHAASVADGFARPVHIALVLVVAFVANRLARHLVHRVATRLKATIEPGTASALRRQQRADTTATVLRSAIAVAIWTIAIVTVLGELGVDLVPLLAGAGVAGVALGFGAQSIVRDFLAGTFMLLEDQFGVGDIIDAGVPAGSNTVWVTGTVESVSLRVTQIRDVEGTLWFVPNGAMLRVGNKAQRWAQAVLDLAVAPDTSIPDARDVIARVADELHHDPAWQRRIPAPPQVWGVEVLTGAQIVIRLAVRTLPHAQWDVARELRERLKVAFDDAGIHLAVPT
jgi:small-conductance mechanosensitive channel